MMTATSKSAPCFVPSTVVSRQFVHHAVTTINTTFVPRRVSLTSTICPRPARRVNMSLTAQFSSQIPAAFDTMTATTSLLSDISDVNRGPLFATAFVFILTFWGGISFVKGSTKDRITQASFNVSEPSSDIAKRTAKYLMERSFLPDPSQDDRKGVMTFTGKVRASSSVAAILVAVAASGLWAATYILNFVLPPSLQSDYWGWLTLASFAIVPWYWSKANRTENVKLMIEQDDDNAATSTLYVKGHRDEIEQLEKNFNWKRNEPVYEDEKSNAPVPTDSVTKE